MPNDCMAQFTMLQVVKLLCFIFNFHIAKGTIRYNYVLLLKVQSVRHGCRQIIIFPFEVISYMCIF